MLLSVHGLIRGDDLELGRDADTGGQTKYVVELARALGQDPRVGRVDLVTRRVLDRNLSGDYARTEEVLDEKVRIIRIKAGPVKYVAKEGLWTHLDAMVDNLLGFLRSEGRVPDLVHGHYADAGYVAARLAGLLDVPMAFTGHSLGRVKLERLRAGGATEEQIERRYKIHRRIEAEESALDAATFVVASTHQEVTEQYSTYDHYNPKRMSVIPPGVDLERFSPPVRNQPPAPIELEINRFLAVPEKPIVLALSRPDPRKNIPRLIEAFGSHERLRAMANLVLIAGNREQISSLDRGARETWWKVLELIDNFDLYGSVAYPKRHASNEVPDVYRLATRRRGVFVNAALTEPFGLTLLEAAASGVPVVATYDGGPQDILENCKNGALVDPLDVEALGKALVEALEDRTVWRKRSRAGLRGVERHYSWRAHVDSYIRTARGVTKRKRLPKGLHRARGRILTANRLLVCDIDGTLVGRQEPLRKLLQRLERAGPEVAFGVATGRSIELTRQVLKEHGVRPPDFAITSVGSAIYYGAGEFPDRGWQQHISHRWRPEAMRKVALGFDELELQGPEGQDTYKVSFRVRDADRFDPKALQAALRQERLAVRTIYSHGAYLDLLPLRASHGLAIRYLCMRLGIPVDMVLVAGDSGNDEEMLRGNTLGVVVGNYDKELEPLRKEERIYFAKGSYARGILEGIDYYGFLPT
ncbi:MAG: HAD-IIB family hydrolase [Myxococcota bacterium]